MSAPHNPIQNHLLSALPVAEFKRLSPHLELTPMPLGEVYYESGGKLQHVYFLNRVTTLRHGEWRFD